MTKEGCLTNLHDELPTSWQSSLGHQDVLGLFFFLSLLNLSQSADWVDSLPIFWTGLQLKKTKQ